MDSLVGNGGFQTIAIRIFGFLDPRSLGQCRLVSSEWRKLIDSQNFWWTPQVQDLKNKRVFPSYDVEEAREKQDAETIIEYYPHWKEVFEHYEMVPCIRRTKNFLLHMRCYFRKNKIKVCFVQCPLLDAVKSQNIDFLRNLRDSPLDFNAPFRYPFSLRQNTFKTHERLNPIHWACRYGNLEVLKFFIHDCQEVDVNKRTPTKLMLVDKKHMYARLTPFLLACLFGKVKVAKYLLGIAEEFGIDVKATDVLQNTALHMAVSSENIKMVKFVLNNLTALGIDINASNRVGASAFHLACGGCDCTTEELKEYAISIGLNYAKLDTAKALSRDTAGEGKYKCLEHLVDVYDETSANATTIDGDTPLHYAVGSGDAIIVNRMLLNAPRLGIDIDIANDQGQTPADVADTLFCSPISYLFNWYERGLLRIGNVGFFVAYVLIMGPILFAILYGIVFGIRSLY